MREPDRTQRRTDMPLPRLRLRHKLRAQARVPDEGLIVQHGAPSAPSGDSRERRQTCGHRPHWA